MTASSTPNNNMKEVQLWYSQAKQVSKILSRILWENEASVNKWKKQNPSHYGKG